MVIYNNIFRTIKSREKTKKVVVNVFKSGRTFELTNTKQKKIKKIGVY
jgi:hypothetical protein